MKNIFKAFGLFVVAQTALCPLVASAQTSSTITVQSGALRQKFLGFGTTAIELTRSGVTPSQTQRDQMYDMIYTTSGLKADMARLWVTTGNDITDPDPTDSIPPPTPPIVTPTAIADQFKERYVDTGLLAALQNRNVKILLAPENKPNWGTDNTNNRVSYPPLDVEAYTTLMADGIKLIVDTYGVTFYATGVANEPGGIRWLPADMTSAIKKLRTKLNNHGLTNIKIVGPETAGTEGMIPHLEAINADGTALGNLGAFASHSYGLLNTATVEEKKGAKEWWIDEAGPSDANNHELVENEVNAASIASIMLGDLNFSVDRWMYFVGAAAYADLEPASQKPNTGGVLIAYDQAGPTKTPATPAIVTYLKYYYLKQLLNTVDVGATFRKCVGPSNAPLLRVGNVEPPVVAAAVFNPDNSWGIGLVNSAGSGTYNVTVNVEELTGTASKTFNVYRSRANQHFVSSGTVTLVNGVGTVAIAAKELVSLRSAASATVVPPAPTNLVALTSYNSAYKIRLNWNNTAGAVSWNVKRSTTSGGPYTQINPSAITTTSYNDTSVVPGVTYYYVVTATNTAGTSANSNQASATTQSPVIWENHDIGTVGATGGFTISEDGVFQCQGAGSGVASQDSFNFTHTTIHGDGTIIARLKDFTPVNAGNKIAGLMMRSTLAADSPCAFVYFTSQSGGGINFLTRSSSGGSIGFAFSPNTSAILPQWLKLVRSGNNFQAYTSSDGTSWTSYGTSVSVSMNNTDIQVGMAVSSRSLSTLATATFDNVQIPPRAPAILFSSAATGQVTMRWVESYGATSYDIKRSDTIGGTYVSQGTTSGTSFTNTGLDTTLAGKTYYYVISASSALGTSADSIPYRPLRNQDVGTVGLTGKYEANALLSTTVSGSGANIGNVSDSFNISYTQMTGDGTIIARLASMNFGSASNTKVGLMVSDSLAPDSKYAVVLYDGSMAKARFGRRLTVGGTPAWDTASTTMTAPKYFKLQRVGNNFTSFTSPDGTPGSWTQIGTAASVTMGTTVLVGPAITSRYNGPSPAPILSSATFDSIIAP